MDIKLQRVEYLFWAGKESILLEGTKTRSKVWPFGARVSVLITVLQYREINILFPLYEKCYTANSLFIVNSTYLSTYSITLITIFAPQLREVLLW